MLGMIIHEGAWAAATMAGDVSATFSDAGEDEARERERSRLELKDFTGVGTSP